MFRAFKHAKRTCTKYEFLLLNCPMTYLKSMKVGKKSSYNFTSVISVTFPNGAERNLDDRDSVRAFFSLRGGRWNKSPVVSLTSPPYITSLLRASLLIFPRARSSAPSTLLSFFKRFTDNSRCAPFHSLHSPVCVPRSSLFLFLHFLSPLRCEENGRLRLKKKKKGREKKRKKKRERGELFVVDGWILSALFGESRYLSLWQSPKRFVVLQFDPSLIKRVA